MQICVIDNEKTLNLDVEFGIRIIDVLVEAGIDGAVKSGEVVEYLSNPIVGVFYNGQAISLMAPLISEAELRPIRLLDKIGRLFYRPSLFLMLYAAGKTVFPDRGIVIGTALGGGICFRFSDEKPVTDEDVEKLNAQMVSICRANYPIRRILMSFDKAREYFKECGRTATVKLMESHNPSNVEMYELNGYLDLADGPLVDRTSMLSVFELRRYKDSFLLRYPNGSDNKSVGKFKDNPKLYDTHLEYRNWGHILNVSNVGELNSLIMNGDIHTYVRLAEKLHRRKLTFIADGILEKDANAVFIAGPSSSGKTTFAKRLCEELQLMGKKPIRISLDDYYKAPELCPIGEDGKPDLECLESLQLDLFEKTIKSIFSGEPTDLPHYSFKTHETYYGGKPVQLTEKAIFVFEGIHGLNPAINGFVDQNRVFKIYISPLTQLNIDDHIRVATTSNRMLRRIVRDNRTRNTSATETLKMWASVARGESKYIFPYQNNADIMFNSALDYELSVLATYAIPLLHTVRNTDMDAYFLAQDLLSFISAFHPLQSEIVPADSLLREFIGGSDYED